MDHQVQGCNEFLYPNVAMIFFYLFIIFLSKLSILLEMLLFTILFKAIVLVNYYLYRTKIY